MSLDEIYGLLTTYELEMQQRKNMKGNKAKFVALNVKENPSRVKTGSSSHSRGKAKYVESDSDTSESEYDTNSDANSNNDSTDEDVTELVALVVKGFTKMGYKRSSKRSKFSKKGSNAYKEKYKKKDGKQSRSKNLSSPRSSVIGVMEWDMLLLSGKRLNQARAQARHSSQRKLIGLIPHTLMRRSIMH